MNDYGMDHMPVTLKAKLLLQYDLFRYDLSKVPEKVCMWIAWKLPRRVVLWAAVRLMAHATTGQYGSQEVGTVSITDALERWEK